MMKTIKPFKARIKPLSLIRQNQGVVIPDMYEYCGQTLNFNGCVRESISGGKIYSCEVENSFGPLSWWWNEWHFDIIKEVDKKGNFLLEF